MRRTPRGGSGTGHGHVAEADASPGIHGGSVFKICVVTTGYGVEMQGSWIISGDASNYQRTS